MRIIHVLRKPLSEANVAANVLKHGTGAINVDAARISGVLWGTRPKYRLTSKGTPGGSFGNPDSTTEVPLEGEIKQAPTSGRWPANLILQHLPGCREAGTPEIPPDRYYRVAEGTSSPSWGGRTLGQGWAGKKGVNPRAHGETVTAWDCEPGCPVADLDTQSGDRPVSGAAKTGAGTAYCEGGGSTYYQDKGMGVTHNDVGGASRFFKQVKADGSHP